MISNTKERKHENNMGDRQSQRFTIDVNRKTFRVLLDTLYTNKIRAIVRELWTNAYDAHLAVGKGDIPFEVGLPSALSPTFWVRDYGVSMTHDEVFHLYTTVFRSSKDESNDAVGMLGLGSKSPFAYTDSFTVEAFLDGECRMYVAALGADGIPEITLVHTTESTEPQGIKVSLPVQNQHFWEMKEEARKVAMGFDCPPIVDGEVIESEKPTFAHNNWKLYRSLTSGVKQGCVIYPVTRDQIILDNRLGTGFGIVVEVPIGTVEIAANREALSFDDNTKLVVQAAFEDAMQDMVKFVDDQISIAPNLLAAEKLSIEWKAALGLYSSNMVYKHPSNPQREFVLRGQIDMAGALPKRMTPQWEDIDNDRYLGKFNVNDIKNYRFVIDRSEQKVIRRRKRIRAAGTGYGNRYWQVLKDPTSKQLSTMMRRMGLTPSQFIPVSKLPDVPPVASGSTGTTRTGIYSMDKGGQFLVRMDRDDIEKDYYWIHVDSGKAQGAILDGVGFWSYVQVRDFFVTAKASFKLPKKTLYLLTPQAQKKADPKMNLMSAVSDVVIANKDDILSNVSQMRALSSLWSSGLRNTETLRILLEDPNADPYTRISYLPGAVLKLIGQADYDNAETEGIKLANDFKEQFPMLFNVNSTEEIKYIEMIRSI